MAATAAGARTAGQLITRRWKCPCCKVEGWSKDGRVPADHDRFDGRVCRAFAALAKTDGAT